MNCMPSIVGLWISQTGDIMKDLEEVIAKLGLES